MEYRKIDESLSLIISEQAKNAAMIMQALKQMSIVSVLEPRPEQLPEPEEVWLLIEDVVRIFKKSARTIYSWRKLGILDCKIIGRTGYYSKKDIEKLLNDREKS